MMLIGLRGVGKTVLLDQMRRDAEAGGIHTVRIEAPEHRSLPAILAPALRLALLHLSKKRPQRISPSGASRPWLVSQAK